MADASAEEEAAIAALHEQRKEAAKALLIQYMPEWFPESRAGNHGVNPTRSGADSGEGAAVASPATASAEEKRRAAEAFAKQRAAAMALLNDHNSDWLGNSVVSDKRPSTTRRKSLLRMIGKGRKSNSSNNNSSVSLNVRHGSYSALAEAPSADRRTPRSTPTTTPSPRSLSMSAQSESPPSLTIRRSVGRLGRRSTTTGTKSQASSRAGTPTPGFGLGSSSCEKKGRRKGSPWFSRNGSGQSASSCPTTPAGAAAHKRVTARSPGVDDDGENCGGTTCSPTPTIQPPLMDVLENKAPEPMSLRSMLRFARDNLMEENVLFYLEVVSFKTGGGGQAEYLTHLKRIKELYIETASPREVNISGDLRSKTLAAVESILSGAGNPSCGSADPSEGRSDGEAKAGQGTGMERAPSGSAEAHVKGTDLGTSLDRPEAQSSAAAESVPAAAAAAAAAAARPAIGSEAVETLWRQGDESREVSMARLGLGEDSERSTRSASVPTGSLRPPVPPLPPRPPNPPPTSKGAVVGNAPKDAPAAGAASAGIAANVTATARPRPARSSPVDSAEGDAALSSNAGGGSRAGAVGLATLGGGCGGSGAAEGEVGLEANAQREDAGREDDEAEDEEWMSRVRDCAMSWESRAGNSANTANKGSGSDFSASMEIEQLGLVVGPGGGYGDRTIFDSSLLEIFVLLRHEVYPKFVARVMKHHRQTTAVSDLSATTNSRSSTMMREAAPSMATSGTSASMPGSPDKAVEQHAVPWSQRNEADKTRRFSFQRRT